MPTVFFSYHLKPGTPEQVFETQMLRDVAPEALAQQTVEGWTLHRTQSWPGSSYGSPDYVCVVQIADARLWSEQAADSVEQTHGALGPLVERIEMSMTEGVVVDGSSDRGSSA